MTKVFIAGSIKIKKLDRKVEQRIANTVRPDFTLIVGDAPGADKLVQQYLLKKNASNVVVYCSGGRPRNNVGRWPVVSVQTPLPSGSRAFFTAKDVEMAKAADYGLMIWDVQSTGTLSNVIELLNRKKKTVVFDDKEKTFRTISDVSQLEEMLSCMSSTARLRAEEKLRLSEKVEALKRDLGPGDLPGETVQRASKTDSQRSALHALLQTFREGAQSAREKGNYFEKIVKVYLRNEPYYADLYGGRVWLWEEWRREWAKRGNAAGADAGIDLVAETTGGELHAIQAKFYADDAKLRLDDFSTFFTASSKKHFSRRLIFLTATDSTHHLREAVQDQHPPVNLISLFELENSKIDWASFRPEADTVRLNVKKTLMPHQEHAVSDVLSGLASADRGKMIMACGTGKTFVALRLAEKLAGSGGRVLFLVPSLNLLSQSLTEWTQETNIPIHSYAVCSDSEVGKKRKSNDDDFEMLAHELQYPATTEPAKLAQELKQRYDKTHMSVVFSTYHSIDVISKAQHKHGLADFDLVVCDEAHRTTGATFVDEDESDFVKVHDANFICAAKRLYMTATPRIYGDHAKASAEKDNVALCSMDDEKLYGKELHVLTFSESVRRGLLVDYKVIVLAVEEAHVSRRLQNLLKDENNQLKVDDAAKIVGCWKALSKQGLTNDLIGDDQPMKRAVAFCQVIEIAKAGRTHKVSSKQIASMFKAVVDAYQEQQEEFEPAANLVCEAEHVDGSMNAIEKEEKLAWLKAEAPPNTCRILSNVRCLSEGVDVPALDAVLFLTPRNSQVEVVQSLGRVMRNTPDRTKRRGYVILPVVLPAGVEPHVALSDNKTYAVVWQVLQALRSHDDRFDAMVNKLDLIGKDVSKMEVIAITDKIQKKQGKDTKTQDAGKNEFTIGEPVKRYGKEDQEELQFEIGEIERAIYAKLVQKVGNRHHWEDWANDIAKIARTHIDRINGILENSANRKERNAFDALAKELRDDLNDSITNPEIVEMLAQHLITKPVFDALFEGYSFAQHNPMSRAMQAVLDILQEHQLGKEADTLQTFYDSVKLRAEGIESAGGKQKIVVELYDKFFRNAFPKMTERLGIVYTPVEVVDFIINSVAYILDTDFGQTLGSKGVHILDPFTGTGTFITRLLQSGLIKPAELEHKYRNEIHANEIVLLAYYIAAINIEATYHGIVGGDYVPFSGICLTDTFQLYEKDDLVDALLENNTARRTRQKKLDIRVIFGNPPYSVGQGDANANNQNIAYPNLDRRIAETYVEQSTATLKNSLYDSYIRAIRWASDRIGKSGVVGFVTNAGFVDGRAADGLRQCLAEEFSTVYVFHLRGNQRTSGELSRKEGGKIFGGGSRAPIAISLLVKNPNAKKYGQIFFHDIGDYLSREDKLEKIRRFVGIAGINAESGWQIITPDSHGDWLKQRDKTFSNFIVIGTRDKNEKFRLFENYSSGVKTQRDAWCYSSGQNTVSVNIKSMIAFYNSEVDRFSRKFDGASRKARQDAVDDFINTDATKISWSVNLKNAVVNGKKLEFEKGRLVSALYRPFTKQWLYLDKTLNEVQGQMSRIFPEGKAVNRAIVVKLRWPGSGQFAVMVDRVVDLQPDGGTQCFPLYLYGDGDDEAVSRNSQRRLFESDAMERSARERHEALTDEGLFHFRAAYPAESICKEDLFYYIYGLLHSSDYRDRYADNLGKELPRIPRVKAVADFWAFSKAGRALADLHTGYETVAPYPLQIQHAGELTDVDYRVEKMRYGKNGKDKDLTTLHYNSKITLTGIPREAYEYVVNGKPALDWVVERQCVKTDAASGIVNDANDWAIETMKNPRYPLELVQRVVTVSLETMKIVSALPKLAELS